MQVFKEFDRLFHKVYGWGYVTHVYRSSTLEEHRYGVKFDDAIRYFSKHADECLSIESYDLLSFVEYEGESEIEQHRTAFYRSYVDKWGVFSHSEVEIYSFTHNRASTIVIGQLYDFEEDEEVFSFTTYNHDTRYAVFRPISEEDINKVREILDIKI